MLTVKLRSQKMLSLKNYHSVFMVCPLSQTNISCFILRMLFDMQGLKKGFICLRP